MNLGALPSLAASMVLVTTIVWPSVARADDLEQAKKLASEATSLARSGDFSAAIEKFKAADALAPSAANDCNIALALVKRADKRAVPAKEWHRADLFLQRCKRRWVRDKTEPLPEWVGRGHEIVIAELNKGTYAPIAVTTEPPDAEVRGSAFGAGETIKAPVTLWLPFGESSLSSSLPGYSDAEHSLAITSRKPQTIILGLTKTSNPSSESTGADDIVGNGGIAAETQGAETQGEVMQRQEGEAPSTSRRGLFVIGGGVAALAVGGVFHSLAIGKKNEAGQLGEGAAFDDANSTFSTYRVATVGFYAVGAATIGVGAFLLWRDSSAAHTAESGVAVGVAPTQGGARASARWRF